MLAAQANNISIENMMEFNEGLFEGWRFAFEELKFKEQDGVKEAGMKALKMAERVYRMVLAEREKSRV